MAQFLLYKKPVAGGGGSISHIESQQIADNQQDFSFTLAQDNPNNRVAVAVMQRGTGKVDNVIISGVAAAARITYADGDSEVTVWDAVVVDGTDRVVEVQHDASTARCAVSVYDVNGLIFQLGTSDSIAGSETDIILDTNTNSGDKAIYATTNIGSDNVTWVPSTNNVENFDGVIESTVFGASSHNTSLAGGAPETLTGICSGTFSTFMGLVAIYR